MKKTFKLALAILGFALTLLLSCSDNPALEFPDEEKNSSSSIAKSSSSLPLSIPSSSSAMPLSSSAIVSSSSSSLSLGSSSSVCKNTETHYCSNGAMKQYGSMTDDDGQTYKTVEIGTQIWMAENLKYNANGSKCGNGSALVDINNTTCNTYGRLYDWTTATKACPSGWHLPSNAEWITLIYFVGNNSAANAGTKLKSTSGWKTNGNGTDDYGFTALPGGWGTPYFAFLGDGGTGRWWSADTTGSNAENANFRQIENTSAGVNSLSASKSYLHSVRCVQNPNKEEI